MPAIRAEHQRATGSLAADLRATLGRSGQHVNQRGQRRLRRGGAVKLGSFFDPAQQESQSRRRKGEAACTACAGWPPARPTRSRSCLGIARLEDGVSRVLASALESGEGGHAQAARRPCRSLWQPRQFLTRIGATWSLKLTRSTAGRMAASAGSGPGHLRRMQQYESDRAERQLDPQPRSRRDLHDRLAVTRAIHEQVSWSAGLTTRRFQ